MAHLNLNDVQRLLKLDAAHPYFESREELLEFTVDGVSVKAVISYGWRCETIKLVEPFHVDGAEYGLGFEPMLVAIGASFQARNRSLEALGLTVRDYWMQTAQKLYRLHSTYLKNKTAIDQEQQRFTKRISDQLAMLEYKAKIATESFKLGRATLRERLKDGGIQKREYQIQLTSFRVEVAQSQRGFQEFQDYINRGMMNIKMEFIKREMPASSNEL